MPAPEFVAIGHVTLDRFGDKVRPGGSVAFAAVTAHRLGMTAGILTSHGDDFPLDAFPPQIEIVTVPAPATTTFGHAVDSKGARSMTVGSAARPLTPSDVPEDWLDAPLVLLAPVLDEVDPRLAATFSAGTVAAAAQGWLRRLGGDHRVVPRPWTSPEALLARVQALFLSREDIGGDEASARAWFERVPVGALTAGAAGATLFVNGEEYAVRARRAREVDETGAGDVFAATFLVHYARDGDPWRAAAAASCAAALATEGEGWSAVPQRAALERALASYAEDTD
ncbi:MAG TPA: PfkB family carbohydrate kinase [Methylomirabilota bacterium]|jgi:sugar/nucleoside kinase (ribokinase family)